MVPPERVTLLAVEIDPPQVFVAAGELLMVSPLGRVFDNPTAVSA